MTRKSKLRPAASGILDMLATRAGMSAALALLLVVCLMAGLYVERSARQTQESRQVFSDRHIRNAFMSLTDIQRLLIIVDQARDAGGFTEASLRAFVNAADYLFVRVDHFRNTLATGHHLESAEEAVRSVEAVLAIADRAIGGGAGLEALRGELLGAAEEARQALTRFLDLSGRMQNEIVQAQARAVNEQRIVVLASLAGLTLVGVAALMLLRREVLGRRARDRAEKHIAYLAYNDQLTDLPNRARFQKHLSQCLARSDPVTLALIDVDNFKNVNDTYGHAAGDAVLRRVAALLSELARDTGALVARLGGDEFAVVLPSTCLAALTGRFDNLLKKARAGLVFEGETVQIGLSIGFANSAAIGHEQKLTVDTLLRVADFALYSSKANGRGQYTLYDSLLERRFLERRTMVEELTRAVASGALEVFFQPKVYLPRGEVYGFEALVRWRRNGRLVPPQEFIRIAEECGLVYEIDIHVLRAAIAILGEHNALHGTALSVSVNLSALHFNTRRVVDLVREALESSSLAGGLVTLEITESAELRDWWEAQKIIAELRALGARISVDDFGAGYSSLAYLRSKAVDEVKIDRSIVEQIDSSLEAQFLLDGILEIASNLGLDVVVEGVERPEQLDKLCRMGAARAQGFLFGAPVPAAEALSQALDAARGGAPDVAGTLGTRAG